MNEVAMVHTVVTPWCISGPGYTLISGLHGSGSILLVFCDDKHWEVYGSSCMVMHIASE